MGISGSKNGGTLVPYKVIFSGDIPANIGLKNRPKIYGIGTSNFYRFLKSGFQWSPGRRRQMPKQNDRSSGCESDETSENHSFEKQQLHIYIYTYIRIYIYMYIHIDDLWLVSVDWIIKCLQHGLCHIYIYICVSLFKMDTKQSDKRHRNRDGWWIGW